ncbi:thiol-disulfide oxidoreductase DCC family protein [Halobellus rarus]|uniref:Thiol-disulfide oxidoreductase DCC family protein n=1 Tax=Halobellus rarus TaxID=1126237 RepID=A0ABD6CP69_9EURY|nr:thiol-disulfide oxidoreductase DCC family protein [Halobellus rarus]
MRSETDDGAEVPETPVVLFDGVCNLCNGVVRFLLPRDPAGRLRFASLQSDAGRRLLERHGLPTEGFDSIALVDGDRVYTKSGAVLRIASLLGWPYRVATVARVIPTGVRDRAYDVVAEHRYEWFGQRDQCMIPDEDVSDRFLE